MHNEYKSYNMQKNSITFLGNYLVDSGGSWLDNLYGAYEVTIRNSKSAKLKGFVTANETSVVSEEKNWVHHNDGTVTIRIGIPSSFEQINMLCSYVETLQK